MYPILTGYLKTGTIRDGGGYRRNTDRERFQTTVASIHAAHAEGSIQNQSYIGAKSIINEAIDEAVKAIREAHINGRWDQLSWEVKEFERNVDTICPYVNTVPGKLKKAKAQAKKLEINHPYATALIALFEEIAPLAPIMKDLGKEPMLVKRKVRTQEEMAEEGPKGYHPPKVSTEAEKRVVALLEGVTEAAYTNLIETLRAGYRASLDAYLLHSLSAETVYSPYDHFVKSRRIADFASYHLVGKLVEQAMSATPYTERADANEIIMKEATETADFFRTQFVHKNFKKLASIVEGKGMPLGMSEVSHSVSLDGLEGDFFFRFEDGSQFYVVNKVVFVVNEQGTAFHRFPLTFHDVLLPGGKKMARPSEARMNTIFLGKPE